MQIIGEKFFPILIGLLILFLLPFGELAAEEGASSGAAASDPTAAVNYQDVRYRYFDLESGDKNSFETEGAFMLNPRLKINNELRYVEIDSSGK